MKTMQFGKPKRKRQPNKKFTIRFVLIALMVVPMMLLVFNPTMGTNLMTDGIALSIMISAAVYILHQLILIAIARYLHVDGYDSETID